MAPWGGDNFQPIPSLKLSTLVPIINYHQKQVEDLQDYPFLPWGETPGSLRVNLASSLERCHFWKNTYKGALSRRNSKLAIEGPTCFFNIHWKAIIICYDVFSTLNI